MTRGARGARTLPFLLLALCAACGQAAAPGASDPVARIGDQVITRAELDQEVAAQRQELLEQHRRQLYQLEKQGLERLVNERLLGAEARRAGLASADAYLQQRFEGLMARVPEPTDAEIQAQYDQARAAGQQPPPLDQVRANIAEFIRGEKARPELRRYYAGVRRARGVKVLLAPPLPPRKDVEASGPTRGDARARLTLVAFTSFQCPDCAAAEAAAQELLAANPGEVRLVARDLPLASRPRAGQAAQAARCAEDQGKYWELRARLFEAGDALEADAIKRAARALGLDGARFDACLDSGAKRAVIEADAARAAALGATTAPAVFVDGRLLAGPGLAEDLTAAVNAALEAR